MDELIKYCEKKYNIQQGCPTIQIGTLAYYRNMDPAFSIADPTEQSEKTYVDYYYSKDADQKTKEHLGTHSGDGRQLWMQGCTIETDVPNSLIFCLSKNIGGNLLENAQKFDQKYDSYYRISNTNAFATRLTNLIIENFKMDWFDESAQVKNLTVADLREVRLGLMHKPISYVKSKTVSIENSQITSNLSIENMYERVAFTKEEKYKNDNEYRLLFTFFHPGIGILPIKEAPVILTLNPLARWLV